MSATGASDRTYDLVSVLYHVLQGGDGDTYEQYIAEAEQAGDDELAGFFRDLQEQHRQIAERAEALLKARLP